MKKDIGIVLFFIGLAIFFTAIVASLREAKHGKDISLDKQKPYAYGAGIVLVFIGVLLYSDPVTS